MPESGQKESTPETAACGHSSVKSRQYHGRKNVTQDDIMATASGSQWADKPMPNPFVTESTPDHRKEPPPRTFGKRYAVYPREDQNEEDYPPGFFDAKEETSVKGGFTKNFKEVYLPSYKLLHGENDSFLTWWNKFRVHVHLRPDNQVPISEKISLLGQVLDPTGPAYSTVCPFLTAENTVDNYEKIIFTLNRRYNYQGSLKVQLLASVEAHRPATRSNRDQSNFINDMRQSYVDLTNAKVDPEEIAQKIITRIQQVIDDDVVQAFLLDKTIPLARRNTWFLTKKCGGKTLEEYLNSMQDILLSAEDPDAIRGNADSIHMASQQPGTKRPGKKQPQRNPVHVVSNAETQETISESEQEESDEELMDYGTFAEQAEKESHEQLVAMMATMRICDFCGGKHSYWSSECKFTNKQRIAFIGKTNPRKCYNCFGTECKPRQCTKPFHCAICRDKPGLPKHHRLLCINPENPRLKKEQKNKTVPQPKPRTFTKRPADKTDKTESVPPKKFKKEVGQKPSTSQGVYLTESQQEKEDEDAWLAEFQEKIKNETGNSD